MCPSIKNILDRGIRVSISITKIRAWLRNRKQRKFRAMLKKLQERYR